ncbi:MAG: PAS domain S-box protein [Fibrobacterota bacterium]
MSTNGEDCTFSQSIVDTVREALLILDDDLRVISANRSFYTKFRVSSEETERRHIFDLGNGQWDIPKLRQLLERIIPEQESVENFQLEHVFEGIGEKVMRINARRMLQDGQSARILVAIEDITAQYQVQKRLEESEAMYRKLTENANSIVIGLDREGRITFFSSFAEKLFGYNRKEVEGRSLVGSVIPEVDSMGNDNNRIITNLLEKPEEFYSNESEGMRRDNSRLWFSWSASALRDESGEVSQILIDGNDITELAKTRREATENAATLNTLLDFIPEGIIITDAHHVIRKVSRNMGPMLGLPVEKLIGANESECLEMCDLYWPDGAGIGSGEIPTSRAVDTGQTFTQYEMEMRVDGTSRVFSVNAAPVLGMGGEVVGAIGTWRDITESRMAQEALRQSETRLSAIMNQLPVGVGVMDKNGKFILTNPVLRQFVPGDTVPSRDPLLRDTWRVVDKEGNSVPPENWPSHRALKGEQVVPGLEFLHLHGDREMWISVSAGPFRSAKGEIEGAILVGEEITERKKAMDEAKRRRAEVEAILDSIPDGYIVYDQNGEVVQINDRARTVLGLSDEKIALSYAERIKHLKIRSVDGTFVPVERIPSYRAFSHREVVRDEILRISREGRHYWVSVSASPIVVNDKVLGAFMEFSDITGLHELQEKLTGEKNFTNAILYTSAALITVFDLNGRILQFNRACEILTGYSAQEMIGKSIFQLIPDDEREEVKQVAQRLHGGELMVEYENHWITRTGEKRLLLWRNSALKGKNGDAEYGIATGIDITHRKYLEEEVKRRMWELDAVNKELEAFSYSVSHDLRTPLSVITSFSSILLEDYANIMDEEGKHYLKLISDNVEKMRKLIDDILSLSRVGRYEMSREEIDLSEMAGSYLEELRRADPVRRTEFNVQQGVHAVADPRLLHIALENLLRNAWKFTSKRDVTRIEFGTVEKEGQTVYFIRDNGAGFDGKFAEKIFEPFRRVHAEKEFTGTGVGLSIVQRVISRHGGRVWAEGEVGEGAVFYFTLG